MALIQSLINPNMYEYKCPYSMTPKGICIHNTANDASARNEIAYMQRNYNEVSFHIAVDDNEAIQGLPLNRNAWATGDGANGEGNRNYIQVEICYSKSGGDRFINAEKRAAKEVALLLKQYGWGIDHIRKHQDFNGKYCPHRTLDMGWQRFLNMIQAELNKLNNTSPAPNISNSNELYRVRKSWTDVKSQLGAYSNLDNAIKSCPSGYYVFNSKGNVVYPTTNATDNATVNELYRIRKSWNDVASQKGAYRNKQSAIDNCPQGYSVYNLSGVAIYSNIPKVTKYYLNLLPHVPTWRVYPLNVSPIVGNEIGKLAPSTYGGLSYEILEDKGDIKIINTQSFGKVQIYAPRDNDSSITQNPIY